MKLCEEEINWKGIGNYLSAARILNQHGTGNLSGPKIHCQGLALELALKYYLWDKDGIYPQTHDLAYLAFKKCQELSFSEEEITGIKCHNLQYLKDGHLSFPSRYAPTDTRIFNSMSQHTLEPLIVKIIQATSKPELAERILKR